MTGLVVTEMIKKNQEGVWILSFVLGRY